MERAASPSPMSLIERGVLYVATGAAFLAEAQISAESVRRRLPGLPLALVTDRPMETGLFDLVIPAPSPSHSFLDKARYLGATPFTKTVFLDTDTYCIGAFDDLFALLDRVDFAAAHAPLRLSDTVEAATGRQIILPVEDVPDCFPEFNSGVIAFRRSERVLELVTAWHASYAASRQKPYYFRHDQPLLRRALYLSDLRLATLTPEYNFRLWPPSYVNGAVKLLHGRWQELGIGGSPQQAFEQFAVAINADLGARTFLPGLGIVYTQGGVVIPIADPARRRQLAVVAAPEPA